MICTPCGLEQPRHDKCIDVDREKSKVKGKGKKSVLVEAVLKEGRAYRSCACQHKPRLPREQPTVTMGADE